jgi:hypothetical protein
MVIIKEVPIKLAFPSHKIITVYWQHTVKMLSDPRDQPGIGDSLIKLFLAGNSSGISGFPEVFRSWSGKNFPSAEEFPTRKSFISYRLVTGITH